VKRREVDTAMKETIKTTTCDRANDLISFLYGEADDAESRNFEQHLTQCGTCQNEISSFGQIRGSIGTWKAEALSSFAPQQVMNPAPKKSAMAAIREFFDLSPLWLKGVVAFASLLFCAMVVWTLARSEKARPQVVQAPTFSQKQVDEAVASALKKQAEEMATAQHQTKENVATGNAPSDNPAPRPKIQVNKATQWAKVRRPLSKSEKEQLAADLRLSSSSSKEDEDNLKLLTDRINQEF